MYKLWRQEHLEALPLPDIPEEVLTEVRTTIDELNRYYGADREVDADLGGYVALFPRGEEGGQDYLELLNGYHLTDIDMEDAATIHTKECGFWKKELFLCSSDYHIVVMRPTQIGQKNLIDSHEREDGVTNV